MPSSSSSRHSVEVNRLEHYAIPHDPEAVHQLHWQPGQHGKGIISRDGTVHTWPVDRQDGEPGHRRYIMETMGTDPYGPNFRGPEDEHSYFWIGPEGDFQPLQGSGPEQLAAVQAVEPRIGPPQGDWNTWHFGDAQEQERTLHGG